MPKEVDVKPSVKGSIRLYLNQETEGYRSHWHNAYELITPIENRFSVTVEGTVYRLQPGEVLLIPSGVVHELAQQERGRRVIFLVEKEELLAIDDFALLQRWFYPCQLLTPEGDGESCAHVVKCLEMAAREIQSESHFGRTAARAWLHLALTACGRALLARGDGSAMLTGPAAAKRTLVAMQDACAFITEHCDERLTLEGLAAQCGYSKYHFTRLFSEYTGISFHAYLNRQRMSRCRQLLMDGSTQITEIALRAGFGSIATFNRVFREVEGMTPSQFRDKHANTRVSQMGEEHFVTAGQRRAER